MIQPISEPYKFSFVGNKNELALQCQGYKSAGRQAVAMMAIIQKNFIHGARYDIVLDGESYEYEVVDNPKSGTYPYTVAPDADMFTAEMNRTPGLCDAVTVVSQKSGSQIIFTFTYKNNGPHVVEFYSVYEDVETGEFVRRSINHDTKSWVEGIADEEAEGYGVSARVEVATNDCGVIEEHVTEPIYFEPDNADNVRIQLDVLNSYKVRPDLPAIDETFGLKLCTNALMRYKVLFNDAFVIDGKRREFPRQSTGYKYAFNGEEVAYFASLNLPDWRDSDISAQLSYNKKYIPRVIGSDDQKVCRVGEEQPEYLYVWYYVSGLSMQESIPFKCVVEFGDGKEIKIEETVRNGNLYRLACGPRAVDMAAHKSAQWYRVVMKDTENDMTLWTRTYVVRPSYYNQRYMLLQDKYGLLRSVEAYTLKREVVMEGDGVTRNGEHSVNRTNTYELWKSTTSAMTSDECKLFATSVKNDYHYVWTGAGWKRMSLEPITLTALDDGSDLVQMELSYRLATDQTENAATNPEEAQPGSGMLETEQTEEAITTENDFGLEVGPVGLDDLEGVSPFVLAELKREEVTYNELLID